MQRIISIIIFILLVTSKIAVMGSNTICAEFQRMMNRLDSLGYSQQTGEEYKQSVEKALKGIENETKE